VAVIFDFFFIWLGQLIGLLLIIILLILIFKLISGMGSINVYTREFPIRTESDEELETKLTEIETAMEERGYKVKSHERGFVYSFFGVEMELKKVTRPFNGIVFNLKLTPISIIVGLILLILYPVGWLILIIYSLFVYQKYREITEMTRRIAGIPTYI